MPNKPTTLREEFEKGFGYSKEFSKPIADWWLDKFSTYSTELVRKIEEVFEKHMHYGIHGEPVENPLMHVKDLKRFVLEDLESFINQEK